MKIIDSSFEIVPQGYGKQDIFKHIELCGRVSYKSEDKITDDSANEFVGRRIADGHTAILEQGTVYLEIPNKNENTEFYINSAAVLKYMDNPYSVVTLSEKGCYVTTNYRVLFENKWLNDIDYLCAPTDKHEKRVTVKFVTSRGITHELVRHRVFSFVQESTRYCNYSKGKFGEELTFVKPSWYDNEKDTLLKQLYDDTLYSCEQTYLAFIKGGFKPQEARGILINDLKAEIYMTGFVSQWVEFFKLRTAINAHPDMRELVTPLMRQFKEQFPEAFDTNN